MDHAAVGYRGDVPEEASILRRGQLRLLRFARRHPTGAVGAGILIVISFLAIFADILAPFPYDRTVSSRLMPLFSESREGRMMLLGSDQLGRDVLSRMLHGGRTSLAVGILAPLVGVTIGTLLGITSAYFGGVVDLMVQRVIDALIVLPGLVLAITIMAVFGFSMTVVILAIAVNMIGGVSRVVRSRALSLSQAQYVEGARAVGASNLRIILHHLVPNSISVSIVLFAVGIGSAVIAEAGLSFLGLGIQPPIPSWGNMLTNAQTHFNQGPHVAVIPGLTIVVVVLSINLFGDALRDAIDPRLRGRR